MNKIELKDILLDQNKERIRGENIIQREVFERVESYLKNPFVVIISGIRRCGKSTLLNYMRDRHKGYYINFDDDRLVNFKLDDFQTLYELFLELYGKRDFFYFDEIQNIEGWERFVRRIHDEGKKVFITGSNASMLSKELGTHLTGRHITVSLFPFSFREFLRLKEIKVSKNDVYLTDKKAIIKKKFGEYLKKGGFPEYLKTENKEYLKTLYENILYRDIIVRYKLTNERVLKELVYLSTSSISREISFNSIKRSLGLGSSTTVKDYFDFLKNSFLVFLIPKFDYSLRKQIYSSKKIYFIDTALALNVGYRISKDLGKLLENLVFIELKRSGKEIFYYSDKYECDFVVKDKTKITQAIQVCYDFNERNKEREINGLVESLEEFKLKKGLILTYDQEKEVKVKNKIIRILPVWKWLLR